MDVIPDEIKDVIVRAKEERQKQPSKFDKADPINKVFFCWANPLIAKGCADKLRDQDLELPLDEEGKMCYEQFEENWKDEVRLHNLAGKEQPSLLRALRRTFWHQCALAALMKLAWGILILLSAFYFVRTLVSFAQDRSRYQARVQNITATNPDAVLPPPPFPEWYGWVLAAFFFLSCYLLSMAYQQMTAFASRAGIRIRGALMIAVFTKAVQIEGIENEVSDIIGLVSYDCYQLLEGATYMHYLWSGPLESLAIIALLIFLTGVSALVGLGLILLLLPLQFFIAFKMAELSMKSSKYSEKRVGLLSEVLMAIKLIKFYAWEEPYKRLVEALRKKELKKLWIVFVIGTMNLFVVFVIPPLLALGIFGTYVSTFGKLTPAIAFTTLSLFNTLRMPLVVLPTAVHSVVESVMAMKRIQAFLLRDEMPKIHRKKKPVLKLKDVSVAYQKNLQKIVLKNVSFSLKPGKLMAILGPVGSGKSSIINAILGEARIVSGSVKVGGNIAYVPQSPWVQQTTLRNNILFGLPYNKKKYEQALYASALEADLPSFVFGDQTEIAEGGINISGGQKQRLAIARAIYSDADIFLFDSPLSAVDQHTTAHIFNNCLKGVLKNKTIILVTHHLDLLDKCDIVCLMSEGGIKYCGKFKLDFFAKEFPGFFDDRVEAEKAQKKKLAENKAEEKKAEEKKAEEKKSEEKKTEEKKSEEKKSEKKSAEKRLQTIDENDENEDLYNKDDKTGDFEENSDGNSNGNSNNSDSSDDEADGEKNAQEKPEEPAKESTEKKKESVFPSSSAPSFARASNDIRRSEENVRLPGISLRSEEDDRMTSNIEARDQNSGDDDDDNVSEDKPSKVVLQIEPETSPSDGIPTSDKLSDDSDEKSPSDEISETSSSSSAELSDNPTINSVDYYTSIVSPHYSVMYDDNGDEIRSMRSGSSKRKKGGKEEQKEDEKNLDIFKNNTRVPYFVWFKEISYIACIVSLIIFGGTQAVRIVSDVWISTWTTGTQPQWYYIAVYAGLVAGFGVGLIIRGIFMFRFTLRATRRLHDKLLEKIIVAPITFFTVTPIGPLLNSFSKDLAAIDFKMPMATHMGIIYVVILLTSLILVCIQIPYYTVVCVALLLSFLFIQWYSAGSAQFAKQRYSETSGPIFAHISETLNGISVVRSFRAVPRFLRKNVRIINDNHAALFNVFQLNLWISYYLDFVGVLLVFATALFVVGDNTVSASAGGLAISNSIQILVFFSWLVREFSTVKSEINAVHRVDSYITQVKSERLEKQTNLPRNWPKKGKIQFKDVVMSYFENDPPVLRGVSFTIYPGEKIGIVGRTGSGKTTLLMALFRLVEASGGTITVDGVNLAEAGLQQMRSRLSIIPQDPVLFRGTVKSNLDPVGRYKDKDLWRALKLSGVARMIPNLKLETEVLASGSNFSLGQKQCFCLARAILKNSRVLVLDEATSAMDLKTDAFIQDTIRKVFAKQTVITIAHRLDTIIDYNRILVMDKGKIIEFDTPKTLLANKNGAFYKLAYEAGLNALLAKVEAAKNKDAEAKEQKKDKKKKTQ